MIPKTSEEIRTERLRENEHRCTLTIAPLWPKKGSNVGTIARTADAVGACLALPDTQVARRALHRANTIGDDKVPVHWLDDPEDPYEWLVISWMLESRIVAAELAHGAIPICDLRPSHPEDEHTVLVLGNEAHGVPQQALDLCTEVVEVEQRGVGNSLNVACVATLVAYKLMGMV